MMYSEANYYSHFKRIRNKLRRYDPLALIAACLNHANGGETFIEKVKRQPWLTMLLIKWICLDEKFSTPGRPAPSLKDFNGLLKLLYELSEVARNPSNFDNVSLFLRSISYQQFIYQFEFSSSNFGRQFLLFGDLPKNHRLRTLFNSIVGIDIDKFLQLSVATVTAVVTERRPFINSSWFNTLNLAGQDGDQIIEKFISSISIALPDLHNKLKNKDDRVRPAVEFFEQTVLLETPLLMVDGQGWIFHPNILFRALEHFIYNKLRGLDAGLFMNHFGKIFETYVEKVLREIKVPIITEREIAKFRETEGNLIDFIVLDKDANVFVDAKGVPDTNQIMTTHLGERVHDRTEASAVKGIKQALNVKNWLENNPGAIPAFVPEKEPFLIVVTYKELYLGNGARFRDIIGHSRIQDIYFQYGGSNFFPLENIYFMSIESFEDLCDLVGSEKIGMSEALRRARESDAQSNSSQFDFRGHLLKWGMEPNLIKILKDRIDIEMTKIEKMLNR